MQKRKKFGTLLIKAEPVGSEESYSKFEEVHDFRHPLSMEMIRCIIFLKSSLRLRIKSLSGFFTKKKSERALMSQYGF